VPDAQRRRHVVQAVAGDLARLGEDLADRCVHVDHVIHRPGIDRVVWGVRGLMHHGEMFPIALGHLVRAALC
jgi:hypothetical protein